MTSHTPDKSVPATEGVHGPSSRRALLIGAVAALLLASLLVTVVVIALADGEEEARAGAPMIGHIHGIVPDPGSDQTSGRVLIGAHYGLFAVDDDGTVTQVDEGVTDYMAVTDAGPGRLLASGHPDPADRSRPANLGLIESRDGGRTWQPRSLDGAADFHALEHASTTGRIWGIDSVSGGLVTSTDERRWQPVHERALVDIAVDPGDPDRVVAARGDGVLLEVTVGRDGGAGGVDEDAFGQAPPLGLVDWPAADVLVGIGAAGEVFRSKDGGATWTELARTPGEPSALSVIGDCWYAATSEGLFRGSITPDTAGEEATRLLSYR